MTGNLIFGGPGRGASASNDVVSSLTDTLSAADFPPLGGAIALAGQAANVGLPFAQTVRPGRPYDFVCTIGAAQAAPDGGDIFDPLSIKKLPVLADRPTNLGHVPWLPREVFDLNDGGELSPVWAGVEGSPAFQPGAMNSSGSSGVTAGNGPSGGAVQKLLALPVGSSGSSQLLVWTDVSGAVWFANDQGGGFGTANTAAYDSAPATLVGASDSDGGAIVAWALAAGGIFADDYQAQGWNALGAFDAGLAVAVAAGGRVVFTTADSSTLQLLINPSLVPTPLSAPQGTFTGVSELVAVRCQTDVADGLCLVWTDMAGGLHGALADPAAGAVDIPDGGPFAMAAQSPSIAQFIDPIAGTPYVVVSWVDGAGNLQWGYLTSMIDASQWTLQPAGVTAAGPALLLPWQGVPLAVYQNPDFTMAATALPTGVVPSPVFSGEATSQAPGGFAAADGTLGLGLIDPDGGPTLFQLTP